MTGRRRATGPTGRPRPGSATGVARTHRHATPGAPTDRGSGTVLVLVVMMVLCAAGGSAALVAAAIGVRHQAETAADLAALSAAAAVQRGTSLPCAVADRVARAHGANLENCRVDGELVTLSVTLQPRGPLVRLPPARGRARAGPTSAPTAERG